ncbi:hypothetical protein [Lactobacillus sp. PSON]|uniref:hypothetical protein n=1 Tax=Lactobacillus sp. PSON TaxID=3455454 RepID=UPI0040422B18
MLKKWIQRIGKNPMHIILGLVLIGIGIDLILNDRFFFWPPYALEEANSDFLGTWALFTGLGIIYVGLQKRIPVKANLIWLISACAFLGFETFMETVHGIITPEPGRMFALAIEDFGYLLLAFAMVRTSDTGAGKK